MGELEDQLAAIGARMKRQRKIQGYTQIELAEQLGIRRETLDGYEKGNYGIRLDTLIRMAQLFELPSLDVILYEGPTLEQILRDEVRPALAALEPLPSVVDELRRRVEQLDRR